MDDQRPDDSGVSTAGHRAGSPGVVRRLFDIDTYVSPWSRAGWRWVVARLVLFVVGSELGSLLWRIVDPTGDRSFLERLVTNVYIWACVVVTASYALQERRARRRAAVNE
ncbi:hypothetical protein [Kribbella sp. ALI-6-A]|uniref:hypothetical protein n=1 Tax=Kribbella sp. ALI-6-A TaxID=1933817 RepID=UPI00117B61C1|nr:hypothetical protein [Kribbella sp. ALI-6-A]